MMQSSLCVSENRGSRTLHRLWSVTCDIELHKLKPTWLHIWPVIHKHNTTAACSTLACLYSHQRNNRSEDRSRRWISGNIWKEWIEAFQYDSGDELQKFQHDFKIKALERRNQMEIMSDCGFHERVVTFSATWQAVLLMEAHDMKKTRRARARRWKIWVQKKKKEKRTEVGWSEEETSAWKMETWEEEKTRMKDGNHINHCCQMKTLHLRLLVFQHILKNTQRAF